MENIFINESLFTNHSFMTVPITELNRIELFNFFHPNNMVILLAICVSLVLINFLKDKFKLLEWLELPLLIIMTVRIALYLQYAYMFFPVKLKWFEALFDYIILLSWLIIAYLLFQWIKSGKFKSFIKKYRKT